MAVSSRALLANGGGIDPTLYKTSGRGKYESPQRGVTKTPVRTRKVGRLQKESKAAVKNEKQHAYSYISLTIPNAKSTISSVGSDANDSEAESETLHQNSKNHYHQVCEKSTAKSSVSEPASLSGSSEDNINDDDVTKNDLNIRNEYTAPSLTRGDENSDSELLLSQARGIFTPGTPSSRETNTMTPSSRYIYTPYSQTSLSSLTSTAADHAEVATYSQQTRDIFTPMRASLSTASESTPPMSSSSKVQEELHEKSKRREFLYSYFNRPDEKPYGRSRISFEKSVRASDREISVARRTVKSGTTRTSEQYGILNVSNRIKHKMKDFEWPKHEDRTPVDYTKDNPGPGSYDPILHSALPQYGQAFLKQKRKFIPVQKLNDPPFYIEKHVDTKLSISFTTGERMKDDTEKFASFRTPGPKYNLKSFTEINKYKTKKQNKARARQNPFGTSTQQRPSILRCEREAPKVSKFIESICGLNVTLKKDAMLVSGLKKQNLKGATCDHMFVGGLQNQNEFNIKNFHPSSKFSSLEIDGAQTISSELNFSRSGGIFYQSAKQRR